MISKKQIKAIPFPNTSSEAVVFTAALVDNCIVIDGVNVNGKIRGVFIPDGDRIVYRPENNRFTTGNFKEMVYKTFGYRTESEEADGTISLLLDYVKDNNVEISEDYFNRSLNRIMYLLNCLDDFATKRKENERIKKYESDIDNVMKKVRKIPESFEKTIRDSADKAFIFFDRKKHKAYCMECGTVININEFGKLREKDEVKCPSCRKRVQLLPSPNNSENKI